MSYKFVKTIDTANQFDNVTVTFEMPESAVSLTDLIQNFELFLRACGYGFEGHLDVVDEGESV